MPITIVETEQDILSCMICVRARCKKTYQYKFSSVSLWNAFAMPISAFVKCLLTSTPLCFFRYSTQNCESAIGLPLYSIHGVFPLDENFALWSF